jgi:hypothetical protein
VKNWGKEIVVLFQRDSGGNRACLENSYPEITIYFFDLKGSLKSGGISILSLFISRGDRNGYATRR